MLIFAKRPNPELTSETRGWYISVAVSVFCCLNRLPNRNGQGVPLGRSYFAISVMRPRCSLALVSERGSAFIPPRLASELGFVHQVC